MSKFTMWTELQKKNVAITAYAEIISDHYMVFFISHVLSALGSISTQEPHGSRADNERSLIIHEIWKMTCYDLFIICFNNGEKNHILILLRGSNIEVQILESSRTSDPKFSTVDMKSFYHMLHQRRKTF